MTQEQRDHVDALFRRFAANRNTTVPAFQSNMENTIRGILLEGRDPDVRWLLDLTPRTTPVPSPEEVVLFLSQIVPLLLREDDLDPLPKP